MFDRVRRFGLVNLFRSAGRADVQAAFPEPDRLPPTHKHPEMSNVHRQLLPRLIGKRWAANGRGPDEFDCWHLARHVQRELFGRNLPSVDVPPNRSWNWMLQTIGAHPEQANWFERLQPNGVIVADDGALVLMARVQRAAHIGVWLLPEQGVIHCDQTSGVVFEDAATLRAAGWRKLMFYEPRSARAI